MCPYARTEALCHCRDILARVIHDPGKATQEQAHTANEVNAGIQNVATVTETNASASEEMAGSAEELAGQASQLKDLVASFKI